MLIKLHFTQPSINIFQIYCLRMNEQVCEEVDMVNEDDITEANLYEDDSPEDDFMKLPPQHSEEEFRRIVGEIESILAETEFSTLQQGLMEKYWHHFEVK